MSRFSPEGDEAAPPLHERYRVQQDQGQDFYHWSLYTDHHNRGMDFGDHFETEMLFEIKTICQFGKTAKNGLIKNRKWGGKLMFTHLLNYGLIHMIEILMSNMLVYRHGGEFSPFIWARIVSGIMQFIANGIMMTPDAPGSIIGRGCIGPLNEVFGVDLPKAFHKMKYVLEFCMRLGNGVSLPHSMDFSYLQHAWDAANVMLQDPSPQGMSRVLLEFTQSSVGAYLFDGLPGELGNFIKNACSLSITISYILSHTKSLFITSLHLCLSAAFHYSL